LLAIFHFVVAGLTALAALLPVIHLCLGLVMIFGGKHFNGAGGPPPALLGWFFVVFACVFITLGLAMAGVILCAGLSLSKRKHYTFCQVVACIECLMLPLGTVLGVFTLVVLDRPSVKVLFGRAAPVPGKL